MVHFFALGALLFVIDRVRDEPRTIVITPEIRADLERRFSDERGRAPNQAEQRELLDAWQLDEVLYREALEKKLDRNDTAIRTLLIEKLQSHEALKISVAKPSETELKAFFLSHKDLYELPVRYDFQFFTFPKTDANAENGLVATRTSVESGKAPTSIGRPLRAAKLVQSDMKGRVPDPLAQQIVQAKPGAWVRVEGDDALWLLRVRSISGGLPQMGDVLERIKTDYEAAAREQALKKALLKTVERYHFEEAGGKD